MLLLCLKCGNVSFQDGTDRNDVSAGTDGKSRTAKADDGRTGERRLQLLDNQRATNKTKLPLVNHFLGTEKNK